MTLDFYLSEMSVSNAHGGGLTLQRVLGAELSDIKLFVHLTPFATDFPPVERVKHRALDLPMWLETSAGRRFLGCRPSSWLAQKPWVRQLHGKQVATEVARHFHSSGTPLRALICPQGVAALYATEALLQRRDVEYATWVMDDHLVRWQGGSWYYPPQIEALFARHLRQAKSIFVISPVMQEFFKHRFGVDSRVLFSPADPDPTPSWDVPHTKREIRLGYFGALGPWQLDALEFLALHLEGANASLDIFTAAETRPSCLNIEAVNFRGRLSPKAVPAAMRGYHALVLPASFKPDLRHLSEFNIPTKLSECIAGGTVTLVVAPPYAAVVRLLKGCGAAVMINEQKNSVVAEALGRLSAERNQVLQAARAYAQEHLSKAAMRRVWTEGLSSLN